MACLIIHPPGTGHSDVKVDIKYRRAWIYDQLRLRFYVHRVLHTFGGRTPKDSHQVFIWLVFAHAYSSPLTRKLNDSREALHGLSFIYRCDVGSKSGISSGHSVLGLKD
jgi:hypothetical protein